MTPIIESQLKLLQTDFPTASASVLPNGGHLIEVPNVQLPPGWSQKAVTVLFIVPPGYPAAQPDCFWVEVNGPGRLRLEGGGTPQNSNDTNPIPGTQSPATGNVVFLAFAELEPKSELVGHLL